MQQILSLWRSMNIRKRIVVIGATAAVFWAVLLLARMAAEPGMTLLYAGLDDSAAGELVSTLEQRGVVFDVRGSSIYVDSSRRDELRMTLAGEGMPRSSSKGYELLDGMSGFGTTSQMFDAAYWRAKEGELARTIISHPAISAARVHIAASGNNSFQRNLRGSASVSIMTAPGGITPKHARALQFLVASAVSGLKPEDVAIIDSEGKLLNGDDTTTDNSADDRAEALRQRAERLLAARVGRSNSVVEVTVETITRSEAIRERRFDPEGRVAISTETEEKSDTSSGQSGDDVTVASNLPGGNAGQGGTSSSDANQTRERVNFEVSTTDREVTEGPGAIKRLSVAVIINAIRSVDDTGNVTFEQRPEAELADLRELVASAVGLDESRGDVITVKSMQFEQMDDGGTLVESSLIDALGLDVMSIIQAAVLAIVALVLGLFVVRPLLTRQIPARPALIPGPSESAVASTAQVTSAPLTGEIDTGNFNETGLSVVSDLKGLRNSGRDQAALDRGSDDPVARLRNLIGQRQDETIEILRHWLEGEEEKV